MRFDTTFAAFMTLFGASATAAPVDKRSAQEGFFRSEPPAHNPFAGRPWNNMPFITYDKRDALLPFPQFQGDPFTIETKRAIPPVQTRNLKFGPYVESPFRIVPENPTVPLNDDLKARIRPIAFTSEEKRQVRPLPGPFLPPGGNRGEPFRLTGFDFNRQRNRLQPAGPEKRDEAMEKAIADEARIAETFPGYRPRVPPPKNGIELAVCGMYIGRC